MNNELVAALAARNLVTDLAHWAGYGVYTVAQLDHHLLACEAFEAHQEAWGFKPSWSHLISLSDEALCKEIDDCVRQMRFDAECERAAEERAREEEQAHKRAVAAALTPSTGWTIGDLVKL